MGQLGPPMAEYYQIWPNMAYWGAPWDTWDHIRWVERGGTGPSRWKIQLQCSILFNQCSTKIGQLGPSMAKYCQILPNMARKGRFGGPLRPEGAFAMGPKGSNWSLHMWDTMCNPVQLVFNPNRAARPVYGQIWPEMVVFGHNFVPRHSNVDLKVEHSITWPNCPKQTFGFLRKKKTFFWPPHLKHTVLFRTKS